MPTNTLEKSPRYWIIEYAVWLHLVWGALLLWYGPLMTTGLSDLLALFGGHGLFVGLFLLWIGVSARGGLQMERHPRTQHTWPVVVLLAPQQFVLVLSAISAVHGVLRGSYADGTVPVGGALFILADQLPPIFAAWFHSLAVLRIGGIRRPLDGWWRR